MGEGTGLTTDSDGQEHQQLLQDHEDDSNNSGCSRRMQRVFPTGFRAESRNLMHLLPPLVISTMCQWYVQPIATIFAGHLGKIELDAVGLSCSLINVLGYSIAFGMTAACDASFAQTFGGNNKKMMGVYLQKCLFIIMLSAFPCYAIHLNIEGLLQLLGQDTEVARLVGRYLLIHTPGTFSLFLYLILQKFFQSQNIVYPDIWMGVVTHAIHAGLQYLLLYQLNMGVDGSAIALASYYFFCLLFRVMYFFYSDKVKLTWGGWSWQCFTNWGSLAKLAVYGSFLTCAEWWAYEACTILAGLLGTAELGATTIIFNMNTLANAMPAGIAMAAIIQIGQYLGAGQSQNAKTMSRSSSVYVVLTGMVFLIIMLAFPNDLGKIFTNEEDVLTIITSVMPILAFYLFMNSVTIYARYLFRSVAKQKEAAIVVFISYYLLAMPLGYSLMFLTPLRIFGMWLGFLVCTSLLAVIMTARYMWFFDWEVISTEAQIRACVRRQSVVADIDVKQSLVTDSLRHGNYGTLNESYEKPTLEQATGSLDVSQHTSLAMSHHTSLPMSHHTSLAMSHHMSLDVSHHVLPVVEEEKEEVTWRQVFSKLLVILLFVLILLVGVIVRLATDGVIVNNRVPAGGVTTVYSTAAPNVTTIYPTAASNVTMAHPTAWNLTSYTDWSTMASSIGNFTESTL